jgi:large subunit ribosomal protein L18
MSIVLGRARRKARVRKTIGGTADPGRLRLSVFRSRRHIYAQVIDDSRSHTVVAASTLEKAIQEELVKAKAVKDAEMASIVGRLLAQRAKTKKVEKVVFDRGYCLYHGRVKALAEGARDGGLVF